jgi:hypothetical protein
MMLDMVGHEKRLGFAECAHNGLELLCRFKAVAAFLDHLDDRRQMALRPLEAGGAEE